MVDFENRDCKETANEDVESVMESTTDNKTISDEGKNPDEKFTGCEPLQVI